MKIIAIILSVIIHLMFFMFLIKENSKSIDLGGMNASLDEFSSVIMVADLPIENLKEFAIDSVKTVKSDDANEKEINKVQEKINEKSIIKTQIKKRNNNLKNKQKLKYESQISQDKNQIAKDNSQSIPVKADGKKISSEVKGLNAKQIQNYQGLVMAHLSKYKKYPKQALKNNLEEKIKAKVKINENGEILSVKIKNANIKSLKLACLKLFKDAKQLPKPPRDFLDVNNTLSFNITIDYNIKKYKRYKM